MCNNISQNISRNYKTVTIICHIRRLKNHQTVTIICRFLHTFSEIFGPPPPQILPRCKTSSLFVVCFYCTFKVYGFAIPCFGNYKNLRIFWQSQKVVKIVKFVRIPLPSNIYKNIMKKPISSIWKTVKIAERVQIPLRILAIIL